MIKHILHMRTSLLIYILLLGPISISSQAQSVKRQCISSYGTTTTFDNYFLLQTIGQPFNTSAFSEKSNSTLQGFQQPVVFKSENGKTKNIQGMKLTIHPNPAKNSFTIQCDRIVYNSTIYATDLTGKVIYNEELLQLTIHTINCETWSNGIYLITVCDKNQKKSSMKLLINKK